MHTRRSCLLRDPAPGCGGLTAWAVPALLVAAIGVLGAVLMARPTVPPVKLGADEPPCPEAGNDLATAFVHMADALRPSVVSISSVQRMKADQRSRRMPPTFRGSPFQEFFDDDLLDRFLTPQVPPNGILQQGLGTGVIVSDDGYVVTNNHVVRDADEVLLTLWDDRELEAEIVGTDPKTDLALLKVDADGLQPAALGDSDALRVGEWVGAIGNPFGLSSTVTSGIVSAIGRSRMGLAEYEDFIQTDAAINPGNSGGPLVNLRGEVVGINTAIGTRTGAYMGISFAIPINMARSVVESLLTEGEVVRGWLGVIIQDLDEDLAKSFAYEGTHGALVSDVVEGGPAAEAGLLAGDIVVRFDGKDVDGMDTLRFEVAQTRPGSSVPVDIVRGGDEQTLLVEIGRLDPDAMPLASTGAADDLGLKVQTLTPEAARGLGLSDVRGVLVTEVDPLGPAARAGLRPNDVILKVQGRTVQEAAAFQDALRETDLSRGVRLTVQTGTAKRFVFLREAK